MSFPALQNYLVRQRDMPQAATCLWLDQHGQALGRFFNSTLTSAFQPIRVLHSQEIVAYEGYARSHSRSDAGLSLWQLLDHAANDDESIALDRLCRMLHAINFSRQRQAADSELYVSVHARLLTGVSANHGNAFRRILDALGLPREKIVLQLPSVSESQNWLLAYVADNYCRNGFRVALKATDACHALALMDCLRPAVLKVDARETGDEEATARLLRESVKRGTRLIFKRIDTRASHAALLRLGEQAGQSILAQGYLWDVPAASLDTARRNGGHSDLPCATSEEGASA